MKIPFNFALFILYSFVILMQMIQNLVDWLEFLIICLCVIAHRDIILFLVIMDIFFLFLYQILRISAL